MPETLLGTISEFYLVMIPPDFEIPPLRVLPTPSVNEYGSEGEGTIAAILRDIIPLVCENCGTTDRDLFSGVIQTYANNPTDRSYRTIRCRRCNQEEVADRERAQQGSADLIQIRCKGCQGMFRLEELK